MLPSVPRAPVRYQSPDEDSGRWLSFVHRPGDIVISTRSKHGTTWLQMICALLVFQTAELPAPLAELSPWLDWLVLPLDEVEQRLAAQRHRRFIKTHTPLDGLPLDPRVTYLVVARHPLDAAVSLYHQGTNIDRERLRQRTGAAPPASSPPPRPPVQDWLPGWIDHDADPRAELDSLPGVFHHLSDAWQQRWPDLVDAASFRVMRARARELAPDPSGVLRDKSAFFRYGRSGSGQELLTGEQLAGYYARARRLASDDLVDWLHR